MYEAMRDVQRTQNEREETVRKLGFHKIEELKEILRRRFARLKRKMQANGGSSKN